MSEQTEPIAELNNFIVLNKYERQWKTDGSYQSERKLEDEFVDDLVKQGYEFLQKEKVNSTTAMLANVRTQLQKLNDVAFSNDEWERFVKEFLDKPGENIVEKTKKIHHNYINDFVFDDDSIKNIYLLDKKTISRNKLQVIKQFEQTGTYANRYDVTILVNGLPLVHIELKKRGVAIREAFNQIHRYSKESFNSKNSLYKYLQIFVISNGTNTRYFANTTSRNKNTFDFTMNWATSNNSQINDLKDFTPTFLQKNTLLSILLHYSVFNVENTLLIMRPYQIAATERILWKIKSSYQAKNWGKPESGGYIWHTTGSGKTLTSFKAARLATRLSFIDKVFFVVDRKDLDNQTMKEYRKFSPDSVYGSKSAKALKENLAKADNKIIVTTIQKLNNLVKKESSLDVYSKQVVFIFDECHRSQFGQAQKNLNKRFKKFYQFGFTGTPIFTENALGAETTASVFGSELHSYVITDAIRDEKVLKFKVDYNDVRPQFKSLETERDEKKLSKAEVKEAFLCRERIASISQYILNNYRSKTHRLHPGTMGFNAMFAVSSIDAAKLYYEKLNELQQGKEKPLKIATIFSFNANEEQEGVGRQEGVGSIADESFDVSAMDSSAKEFLSKAISDYNAFFKTNYKVDSEGFQNYYRNLSERVKKKEIDLLIVVGMFLTGFDAPQMNTLFVDKNLRYHGLIQAFSRTNRIYDATKTFGNIVTFRNLEEATSEAIKLFGDKNTKNIILEKSYKEYMNGFCDATTGEKHRGFIEVAAELKQTFPKPTDIEKEEDKKAFVKLFGEYLRAENVLQNYDEFVVLKAFKKAFQNGKKDDENALKVFKEKHYVNDDTIAKLKKVEMPSEREIQNYKSIYNDIKDWHRREKASENVEKMLEDWDDVVFEVELLKSQEINLDYILSQIFENNKETKDKDSLIKIMRPLIRSSLDHRAKEKLLIKFINETNINEIGDITNAISAFYTFAQAEKKREAQELISCENLNEAAAKRYINASLKNGFATENGTELHHCLPIKNMISLESEYQLKRETVFQKISKFVNKFNGVGGTV